MQLPPAPTPTTAKITIALTLVTKRKKRLRAEIFISPVNSEILAASISHSTHPSVGEMVFLKNHRNPWHRNINAVDLALKKSSRYGWETQASKDFSSIEIEIFDETMSSKYPIVSVVSIDIDGGIAKMTDNHPSNQCTTLCIEENSANQAVDILVRNVISKITKPQETS